MNPRKPAMKRKPQGKVALLCEALAKAAPFVLALAAVLRELHPFLS